MSINREMHPVTLQVRKKKESPTGAASYEWIDYSTIDVAIYKTNDTLNTQSIRYNESSHTGLTYEKEIKENQCRLKDQGIIYEVTSADPKGRLTTLLLKAVDTDA